MCCSPQILSNDTLFPGDRTRDYRHLVVFTPFDNPAFCHPCNGFSQNPGNQLWPSESRPVIQMYFLRGYEADFIIKQLWITLCRFAPWGFAHICLCHGFCRFISGVISCIKNGRFIVVRQNPCQPLVADGKRRITAGR